MQCMAQGLDGNRTEGAAWERHLSLTCQRADPQCIGSPLPHHRSSHRLDRLVTPPIIRCLFLSELLSGPSFSCICSLVCSAGLQCLLSLIVVFRLDGAHILLFVWA